MFKDEIRKISDEFIKEATMSPKLLEDMAAMEKYMAESYSNRAFIELLQNADDAASTKIYIYEDEGNVYFANNGRCFSESDLLAICRSGASNKERGTSIGYRGIGFKSTTQISNEILIFSNGEYFSFSKKICAKILGKNESIIPTVRIPILIEEVDISISKQTSRLVNLGYSTIFIFKKAKIEVFLEELKEIQGGYFIFLKNICECNISFRSLQNKFKIYRDKYLKKQHITIVDSCEKKEWLVINSNDAAVAFKIEDNMIVKCKDNEAVYHSYLPTMDKVVYACKINADFSTDPSRKHITYDENTVSAIDSAALLIFETITMVFDDYSNDIYKNILELFLQVASFSKSNIQLVNKVKSLIVSKRWLKLNSNIKIRAKDYKIFPESYTKIDIIEIRNKSEVIKNESLCIKLYENINSVDKFLEKYTTHMFSCQELITILEDEKLVSNINNETYGRLMTDVLKKVKQNNMLSKQKICFEEIVLPTKSQGFKTIRDIRNSSILISEGVRKTIKENLITSEINWFLNETGIKSDELKIESKINPIHKQQNNIPIVQVVKPFLTKWRNAEQKCMEIERILGNIPTDVSTRNEGYDILSITPEKQNRYIEVKVVKKDWGFSITNNEYTAASQYKEAYYICLICENTNNIQVRYIQNPLVTAVLEKRIKQWEWACFEFDSIELEFDLK